MIGRLTFDKNDIIELSPKLARGMFKTIMSPDKVIQTTIMPQFRDKIQERVRKSVDARTKNSTGALRESINTTVGKSTGSSYVIGVVSEGPPSAYARIIEEGGSIKASKRKYLTIPVGRHRKEKPAPHYAPTYIIPVAPQKILMFHGERREHTEHTVPIFVLKPEVTIPKPGAQYAARGLDEFLRSDAQPIIEKALRAHVGGAFKRFFGRG